MGAYGLPSLSTDGDAHPCEIARPALTVRPPTGPIPNQGERGCPADSCHGITNAALSDAAWKGPAPLRRTKDIPRLTRLEAPRGDPWMRPL